MQPEALKQTGGLSPSRHIREDGIGQESAGAALADWRYAIGGLEGNAGMVGSDQ